MLKVNILQSKNAVPSECQEGIIHVENYFILIETNSQILKNNNKEKYLWVLTK